MHKIVSERREIHCKTPCNLLESSLIDPVRWETGIAGFYTALLEGNIARDSLASFPTPAVYNISGHMGGGFVYTTGAEAENSAINFSKESAPLYNKLIIGLEQDHS